MNEYGKIKRKYKKFNPGDHMYMFFHGLSDFKKLKLYPENKKKFKFQINFNFHPVLKYAALTFAISALLLTYPVFKFYKKYSTDKEYRKILYNELIFSYFDNIDDLNNGSSNSKD